MKKTLIAVLAVIVIAVTSFAVMISSKEPEAYVIIGDIISETTEYFENGCYATTVLIDDSDAIMYTRPASAMNISIKHGSKTYIMRNKKGKELWRFTVNAFFSIEPGKSATCTDSYYTVDTSHAFWKNKSAAVSHSDNQAVGDATFIKKLFFINVETKSCQITLTCDNNGNFS